MKRIYPVLFVVVFFIAVLSVSSWPPSYSYKERPLPITFDEFYRQKLDSSIAHHATPGNSEKLIRHSTGRTHIAILYIHGFGASRAEGEYVVDSLANLFNANVYYLRLPGHGTNYEEQATVSFRDYLNEAISTLEMMHQLGDKVIVVGTSMGGLIATYLTAEYPKLIDGIILCSPFYDYASSTAKAIKVPGMLSLVKLTSGPLRKYGQDTVWRKQISPGYDDHWYTTERLDALRSLEALRRFASDNDIFERVNVPTLLLYYYKDKDHHDDVASVSAMKNAFTHFCNYGATGCVKKMVPVADGNHVLTSQYVHSDKAFMISQMAGFLKGF